ncbi:MAG: tetratricopeptide repeat protein [Thermoanaerobaculia bacterium]
MSDRLSRKEIKHDKFVEDVQSAYAVARRNVPILIGIVGGILLLIAVVAGVFLYQAHRERLAQQKLAEAIEILEAPVAPAGDADPAAGTYASEEEKLAKAQPILEEVAGEFSGRDAADVANLYLARLDVQQNRLDEARQKYTAFIDAHPEHVLAQAARVSLYELRLAAGEADQVIADLEAAAAAEGNLPTDVALSLLARAYETANQPEKARETWQRIANEYPDSPYALEAQRKLAM